MEKKDLCSTIEAYRKAIEACSWDPPVGQVVRDFMFWSKEGVMVVQGESEFTMVSGSRTMTVKVVETVEELLAQADEQQCAVWFYGELSLYSPAEYRAYGHHHVVHLGWCEECLESGTHTNAPEERGGRLLCREHSWLYDEYTWQEDDCDYSS